MHKIWMLFLTLNWVAVAFADNSFDQIQTELLSNQGTAAEIFTRRLDAAGQINQVQNPKEAIALYRLALAPAIQPSHAIRIYAQQSMRDYNRKTPAFLDLLAMTQLDPEAAVRLGAPVLLQSFRQFSKHRKFQEIIWTAFKDADPDVRAQAVMRSGDLPRAQRYRLIGEAFDDASVELQGLAATFLGGYPGHDPILKKMSLDLWKMALANPNDSVREMASDHFPYLKGKAAIEILKQALTDTNTRVKIEAQEALENLGVDCVSLFQ